MPPSEPKQTLPISATQLESLASELSQLAIRLQSAAQVARTQPGETLAIYNWPSVPNGLRMLRNFVAKADESRSAAQLGKPVPVGQLKPRSAGARKPTVEQAEETLAKARTKKKRES